MMNIMTVRATEELQQILSVSAKGLGQTRNALILQILWDWVKKEIPATDYTTTPNQ